MKQTSHLPLCIHLCVLNNERDAKMSCERISRFTWNCLVNWNKQHLNYFCSINAHCFAYCPPQASVCGHTVRIKGLWDQTLVLSKWISHREGSRWTEHEDTVVPFQTDFQWATAKTERKKLTTVNYVYLKYCKGNMLLFLERKKMHQYSQYLCWNISQTFLYFIMSCTFRPRPVHMFAHFFGA